MGARWRGAKEGVEWGQKETALGDVCTLPWADDVLLSCTLETRMVLQTNVTPINSI